MKKILVKLLLLVLILMASNRNTYADHLAGSDITYSCTSTAGIYKITYVYYRMCSGIELCYTGCGGACSQSVNLSGANGTCAGSSFGTVSLSLVSVSDINVNPLCPDAKSICKVMGCETAGTYTPGIEKYVFEGTVNFNTLSIPSTCCKIKISWSTCCRPAEITTGSTWQAYYVEATIDRCAANNTPCNSGPVFTNNPVTILCANQPVVFNPGAVDPDGDSLSYAFASSLISEGNSVTYTSPYSYDKPMPYMAPDNLPFPYGIRCNAITGDVEFTPVWSGSDDFVGIVAFEITQWRYVNSVATNVGVTRRDITMWVRTCDPNNSPTFLTNPASSTNATKPKFDWEVSAGQTLCFDIIGKDTDYKPFNSPPLSDTTYLSWNSALAAKGATFLPKYTLADRNKPAPTGGPREDIYEFCWTPDSAMARTLPYYFTASAKDTKCPKPGTATRAFSIKVLPKPPILDAAITASINSNSCYTWNMSYSSSTSSSVSTQKWKVSNTSGTFNDSNNMSFSTMSVSNMVLADTGHFVVKLTLNEGLSNELIEYDTIYQPIAAPKVYPALADTLICKASPILFKATVIKGKTPFQYSWKSTSVLSTADTLWVSPTTMTIYTLTVTDASGCKTYDTVVADIRSAPVISGADTTTEYQATNYSVSNNAGSTYAWFIDNGTINSGQGTNAVSVVFNTIGTNNIKVIETAASTCVSDTGIKTIVVDQVTGVDEQTTFDHFSLYPNPTTGLVTIELKTAEKHLSLEVVDVLGKVVKAVQYVPSITDFTTTLDLGQLKPGMYFITIKGGNKTAQSKITLK